MATKPETLLSRRQAAAILGITENEVKQKDGTVFHPVKAGDGSFRYGVDELRSVLSASARTESESSPDGAVCAAAFTLFSDGKTLAETVMALRQPPALVRTLRAEYDSLVGTLTVPAETVALIEAASKRTVRNASQLLALIDSLRAERDAAYEQGIEDADDYGSVVDPRTGQLVPLNPSNVSTFGATTKGRKENR